MNAASPSFMEIEFTTALPCTHLSPASITENFDESTITGTRAMSGSAAIRLRKVIIAFSESSRPSSMLTSMICAPFSTWSRATASAAGVVAGGDELAELRRAGDVGALADVDERNFRREREGFEARQAQERRDVGNLPRRLAFDRVRDRADVLGRGAAAAADDVDEAGVRELAEQAGHVFRALVVAAELVGQAGIGIGADERVGEARDLGDMRAHLLRAERAVQPDRERRGVAHRIPERLRRLAGEQPAGAIGDRAGDHHRHVDAACLRDLRDRVDRRLGVERVEDRLDQQQIGAAVEQSVDLLGIGLAQLVEGDGAEAGIRHVGRDRSGAVGRPDRAGDEARAAVLGLRVSRGLLCQPGAVDVEFVGVLLHAVIGLRDRVDENVLVETMSAPAWK